jgi:hypothetical protein
LPGSHNWSVNTSFTLVYDIMNSEIAGRPILGGGGIRVGATVVESLKK